VSFLDDAAAYRPHNHKLHGGHPPLPQPAYAGTTGEWREFKRSLEGSAVVYLFTLLAVAPFREVFSMWQYVVCMLALPPLDVSLSLSALKDTRHKTQSQRQTIMLSFMLAQVLSKAHPLPRGLSVHRISPRTPA